MAYTGWTFSAEDRQRLLAVFPCRYPDPVAHHVTAAFGVPDDHPLPGATRLLVVGEVFDDARGVQALVCEVEGTTTRPDGRTYHCTWSLDRARKAKPMLSNVVLAEQGVVRLAVVYPVAVVPTRFTSG